MREDYDEIGHYVRSLSRILLLIAVIIAVPLILSTITAFVRNQSNVSTFHDLLATASVNGLGRTTIAEPTKEQSTPRQAKWADPQEAKTTERAASALPVDYPPDAPPPELNLLVNSWNVEVVVGDVYERTYRRGDSSKTILMEFRTF